jgi:hypothetical protein|tara:strand:- start:23785 stop:24675 length:891 start_codon:yes stop_codon:yes gene_type:complete
MENGNQKILQENIKHLFENATYYSEHSNDIWITTILIVIVLGISMYFYIKSLAATEKVNWEKNKCNPAFMPFAGMINGGSDKFNESNLSNCLKDLTRNIADDALSPINAAANIFSATLETMSGMFSGAQDFIMYLYNLLLSFFRELMLKIQRIAMENNIIFGKINDFISAFLGFISLMYYNLIVIIDSIKLVFPIAAMSFLIGVIMPALVSLVVSMILLAVFYVIAVTMSPVFCIGCWAWGPVAIWIIVVIFMTIFVVFLLTIYAIFAESCNNILNKLLKPVSNTEDESEFKQPPP